MYKANEFRNKAAVHSRLASKAQDAVTREGYRQLEHGYKQLAETEDCRERRIRRELPLIPTALSSK